MSAAPTIVTVEPPLSPAERRARAKAQQKAKGEADKAQEKARIAYAKFMENGFLRNNMNVDVFAHGPRHTHLTMRWVLASKALAFQFTEQEQDTLQSMTREGFKKFTISDGYNESWTWDL
jgi:hypothetical protein